MRMNDQAPSQTCSSTARTVGRRYGGSSIMNGADGPPSRNRLSTAEYTSPETAPSAYRPNKTRPWLRNGPNTERSGTKAAISNVNTGSRAEQVISGADIIVARRCRSFGIVRADMMPGTAHANDDSIATKLRPSSPNLPITRSASSAARARYPIRSSNPMIRNNRVIWGRNTSTLPTPPITPSARSPPSVPPVASRTASAIEPTILSSRSTIGAASVKIDWKKASITATNTSGPTIGWSRTASIRLVRVSVSSGFTTESTTESTHAVRCANSVGGLITGRCQLGTSAINARTASSPRPLWPTTPTTGIPRAADRRSMSIEPWRTATSSIIVSTKQVGRASSRNSAIKNSERSSEVASATMINASGGSTPSTRPCSASATTASSGLIGSRP